MFNSNNNVIGFIKIKDILLTLVLIYLLNNPNILKNALKISKKNILLLDRKSFHLGLGLKIKGQLNFLQNNLK